MLGSTTSVRVATVAATATPIIVRVASRRSWATAVAKRARPLRVATPIQPTVET